MRKYLNGPKANHLAVALAAAGLCNATLAGAERPMRAMSSSLPVSSDRLYCHPARCTALLNLGRPHGQYRRSGSSERR